MSLYGKTFRAVLYPFYETVLRRRGTLQYLAEYERTQWLSAEAVRDRQIHQLRATLRHCREHVPYYRKLFTETGFKPEEFESAEQLAALPILTRELIRENHDQLIDERLDPNGLLQYGTGGSTGNPLQFRVSHDFYERRMAGQFRGYRWGGWDLGEKTLWFWGVSGRITPSLAPRRKRAKKAFYQAAWRNVVKTIYQFSEPKLAEYISFWNSWKPATVVGYAFGTYCIARYVLEKGLSVPRCNGIILAAEATTPQQRETIAQAFRCGVFNTYGSMEVNMIAGECDAHRGMHVNCDNLFVEITRNGKPVPPGEEGDITLTVLTHPAMPFVRYNIGDRGIMSPDPCPCGRGYPLLKEVTGRTMDVIRTPEGNFISGVYFNHTMLPMKEIKRFQVSQESVDAITMRIVPNEGYGPEVETRLETALRNALGPTIAVNFETVAEVELSKSGKYRVIMSKVGLSHDQPAASGKEVDTQ